jgi:ketosteroid isomerase-like protein
MSSFISSGTSAGSPLRASSSVDVVAVLQRQGAVFEITSLEVTAGDDVAFAHALLRCGTSEELERNPDNRLRLTVGMRKQAGQWTVTHEHHSFPSP